MSTKISRATEGLQDLRPLMILVHQYAGFIFAAYIIVICVTGSALILLEDQITGYRDYLQVSVPVKPQTVPLAQMLRSVQEANPGKSVYHIVESCEAGCTYDFSMHDGTFRLDALVDPYTGNIVSTKVWEQTPVGFLAQLHGNLFGGDVGEVVNGIAGFSVILVCLTGLFLWPGWKAMKYGFSVKWSGGSYRINYDLHKLIGVASLLLLLLWAISAAAMALLPEPPESIAAVPKPPGAVAKDLDSLVRAGNATLPGQLIYVYPPNDGAVVLRKRVPGDIDPYGYSYVAINEYTGKVSQVYDMRKFSTYWQVKMAMFAIHMGTPGGIVLRLIYVVVGLAPAVLFITAFIMWLVKLRKAEARRVAQ